MLEPISTLGRRNVISKAKFYFFDTGVVHALQGVHELPPASPAFGDAFETFIFHELRSYLDYSSKTLPINFWRTQTGLDVDFVVDGRVAIEVKATQLADDRDTKGLRAIMEETKLDRAILVSRDKMPRRLGTVDVLPYTTFLAKLWSGELI